MNNVDCVRFRSIKCEYCKSEFSRYGFKNHPCTVKIGPLQLRPEFYSEKIILPNKNEVIAPKLPNVEYVPQYECVCREVVAVVDHQCKALEKVFTKLGLRTYHETKGVPSNIKGDFNLEIVYQYAEQLLHKNHLYLIRFGCALLIAYKFLIRTTKGHLDSKRTQCVWSLQKSHIHVTTGILNLRCTYQASEFNRNFVLTQQEEIAFRTVLKETRGPYIFSGARPFVNSFLRTQFNVDMYTARSSAITATFWKMLLEHKAPNETNERKVESVMQQLATLTNHSSNYETSCKTNRRSYLDMKTEEIALNYLNKKGSTPKYNLNFNVVSFYDDLSK